MMMKLAAVAAAVAALGLFTVPAAQADKPPCTGDRHHNCECPSDDDDCPAPVPVPSGFNVIIGGRHADLLNGTLGRDAIFGLGGNDRLRGHAGDDLILGGRGNDRLRGGFGSDVLRGGAGIDICVGTRTDQFINCEHIILL